MARGWATPWASRRRPRAAPEPHEQLLRRLDRIGLGARGHAAADKVLSDLAVLCDGDLRRALNALEVIALSLPEQLPFEYRSGGVHLTVTPSGTLAFWSSLYGTLCG